MGKETKTQGTHYKHRRVLEQTREALRRVVKRDMSRSRVAVTYRANFADTRQYATQSVTIDPLRVLNFLTFLPSFEI